MSKIEKSTINGTFLGILIGLSVCMTMAFIVSVQGKKERIHTYYVVHKSTQKSIDKLIQELKEQKK